MTSPPPKRWRETASRLVRGPVDAPEPAVTPADLRRRRIVTAVTAVLGTVVLGWSLNVEPGSTTFYGASLVLATIWALGALASGPLHLGRIGLASARVRPILPAIAIGVALAGLFVLGGLVVRMVAVLDDAVNSVLAYARQGAGPLVVTVTAINAIAEEMFFRGALFASVPHRSAVLVTTIVYTLASLTSGNAMLAFAALLLGLLTALERRASGGVLAPILTHTTWSLLMLLALPPLFG